MRITRSQLRTEKKTLVISIRAPIPDRFFSLEKTHYQLLVARHARYSTTKKCPTLQMLTRDHQTPFGCSMRTKKNALPVEARCRHLFRPTYGHDLANPQNFEAKRALMTGSLLPHWARTVTRLRLQYMVSLKESAATSQDLAVAISLVFAEQLMRTPCCRLRVSKDLAVAGRDGPAKPPRGTNRVSSRAWAWASP